MNTDNEIYFACERIRTFCFFRAGKHIMSGNDSSTLSTPSNITKMVSQGSEIFALISRRDWQNLFANQEWLSLLEDAQNLNSLEDGTITPQLKVIAESFPKETSGYIFSEIL